MNLSGDAAKGYFCTMTVIEAPKPVFHGPAVWPLSVKAYHALGEMRLIPEKTELLYGQVFQKMSKSPLHSFLSEFLEDILRGAVPSGCHVRGEEPLTIEDSEPEPDLALVRGRREDFRQAHPTTAELVVEVCVTSHDFDRSKLRAYASAGVKECWLVLGPEKQIEVHRRPQGEQFAEHAVHGPGGSLTSAAVAGFTVELDSLFPA
jgi:Uma2 family endonuclease